MVFGDHRGHLCTCLLRCAGTKELGAVVEIEGRGDEKLAGAVDLVGVARDRDHGKSPRGAYPAFGYDDNRVAHRRPAGAIDQNGSEDGLDVPLLGGPAGGETYGGHNCDCEHGLLHGTTHDTRAHSGHWSTISVI